MMDTAPGRGLPTTVGSDGAEKAEGLRPGGTPNDAAKLGRRSIGGIDGASTDATVRNVLVEPWLILLLSGLLRNAGCDA